MAGPTALLTAKAIKISERLEQADNRPDRLKEGPRCLPHPPPSRPPTGGRPPASHQTDDQASSATIQAIAIYRAHASTRTGASPNSLPSAAQNDPTVAPAFGALVTDLLAALWRFRPGSHPSACTTPFHLRAAVK